MDKNDKALLTLLLGAALLVLGRGVSRFVQWSPPESATPYLELFKKTEIQYGLPDSLLLRVADVESKFRPDIVTGKTVSAKGAMGIMQIVPKWHPNVDPLNVPEAVRYAANYLKNLKKQFGTWPRAVAAYNWGPGNVRRYLDGEKTDLPLETRNYLTKIFGDYSL